MCCSKVDGSRRTDPEKYRRRVGTENSDVTFMHGNAGLEAFVPEFITRIMNATFPYGSRPQATEYFRR